MFGTLHIRLPVVILTYYAGINNSFTQDIITTILQNIVPLRFKADSQQKTRVIFVYFTDMDTSTICEAIWFSRYINIYVIIIWTTLRKKIAYFKLRYVDSIDLQFLSVTINSSVNKILKILILIRVGLRTIS